MHTDPVIIEAIKKLERFCAYQERCHQEVAFKLRSSGLSEDAAGEVIVHLIENDFLNEERFAKSFARGKHRIKSWGRNRIVNELKLRGITKFNIDSALNEISDKEYEDTFGKLAARQWELSSEKNQMKRRKRFCDFLLRKGFESDLVYAKAKAFEKLPPK